MHVIISEKATSSKMQLAKKRSFLVEPDYQIKSFCILWSQGFQCSVSTTRKDVDLATFYVEHLSTNGKIVTVNCLRFNCCSSFMSQSFFWNKNTSRMPGFKSKIFSGAYNKRNERRIPDGLKTLPFPLIVANFSGKLNFSKQKLFETRKFFVLFLRL